FAHEVFSACRRGARIAVRARLLKPNRASIGKEKAADRMALLCPHASVGSAAPTHKARVPAPVTKGWTLAMVRRSRIWSRRPSVIATRKLVELYSPSDIDRVAHLNSAEVGLLLRTKLLTCFIFPRYTYHPANTGFDSRRAPRVQAERRNPLSMLHARE